MVTKNYLSCIGTVCGSIFRPQTGGSSVASYTVECPTPITGTYVSVQTPGRRINQLSQVPLDHVIHRVEMFLVVNELYQCGAMVHNPQHLYCEYLLTFGCVLI